MTEARTVESPTHGQAQPRKIVHRTRGSRAGPITRLMSPGDLGQVLKPFVFLDLFDTGKDVVLGMRPASPLRHRDGDVPVRGKRPLRGYDRSGRESCRKAALNGSRRVTEPGTAGDPATPAAPGVSSSGSLCRPTRSSDRWKASTRRLTRSRATVRRGFWSGAHGGAVSPLKAPASINYLAVRLPAGESWRYQPAIDHTVGWVALSTGRLLAPERVEAGELAIFERRMPRSTSMPRPIRSSLLGRRLRTPTTSCSDSTRCIPAPRRCGPVNSGSMRSSTGCRTKADSKVRLGPDR